MGNFNDIVPKRLNLVTARQATLAEAQNAPIPFDKYYRYVKARDIKKISTFLILPAFVTPAIDFKYNGQLLFQYNVIAPSPFYILNQIVENPSLAGTLTVKWRVGGTVFRYFIAGSQRSQGVDYHTFPFYTNAIIPVSCVFEFWSIPTIVINPGLVNGYKIMLNFLSDPPDPDTIEFDILQNAPFLNVAMGNNLPLTPPSAQPIIAFNSN